MEEDPKSFIEFLCNIGLHPLNPDEFENRVSKLLAPEFKEVLCEETGAWNFDTLVHSAYSRYLHKHSRKKRKKK